ncbi:Chromo domain-like protein [Metarhizium guizhouense ARSEF 977]|uniref:Chromo domain-like protein n=1 Tax=Metarhizium guizhouense (strain ARSEF 977) TaxID=1276136 RepID=A0A0B4GHQ7_METGA|nr:Chromo domain-like protein [Metarhizium guizhouense ARSEF 977]
MAQTAGVCSFLGRPWTLEDVLSIPSDSESDTDSDVEVVEQDVPRVHLVHNQHRDDSLPSISETMASLINVRHDPTEAIWSSSEDLCLPDEWESPNSLTSNSSREVISPSMALESPGVTADSNMLVSPPIQQHDDGASVVWPTPIRRPCVVSAASECCSVQSTTALPPRDEALHHEKTDPPSRSATSLVQPSQSQNCSALFSNRFVQAHSINIGHGRMGEVVPRSDNLRPLPPKRQLTAEPKDGGIDEKLMPQRKRRKLVSRQPKKRNSQQRSDLRSGPTRNREARLLRNTTKSNDDKSVANKKPPVSSSVASHEAWPLGQPVLRCTRENGTAVLQLQFTSDILWNTLVSQNDPAPKGHQTPNKLQNRRPKTAKEKSNQCTANTARESIHAAYPSVCPDLYRMDCLLARWRRHTFLVKWADATTTWEPRKHIIDQGMLNSFEASWRGFDAGVDVLKARQRAGRRQHLLRWHGRPSKEDTWVYDEFLSPQLMERIETNESNGLSVLKLRFG